MKELLTSILETCLLNCSCRSVDTIANKLSQLTSYKYEVDCVDNSETSIVFELSNGVTITFSKNDRHVIKKITCEPTTTRKDINIRIHNKKNDGEYITETRRVGS